MSTPRRQASQPQRSLPIRSLLVRRFTRFRGPDSLLANMSDWLDLGRGRTFPRDLYRKRNTLFLILVAAGTTPFFLLIVFGFVPAPVMLAIADPLNELVWKPFRQVSFEGCGERCWARAYTLISVTLLCASASVLGALALRSTMVWLSACDEALDRGAAPFGLTSSGARIHRVPMTHYLWMLLACGMLVLIVWWMGSTVSEHAGKDWSGSNRRGLRAPSVFSFYWTGVLATIQLMTTVIATFIAPVAAYFRTRPSRS